MVSENQGFAIVFIVVIGSILIAGHIYTFTHVHTEEYTEATIIGLTTVKTGSGWSSASDSRCIMETDEGERINSKSACFFIVGDEVNIRVHDNSYMYITLLGDES